MCIILGLPFREYARQRRIDFRSSKYLSLEKLYLRIQNIKELIDYAYRYKPVGPESARLYFDKFEGLGLQQDAKDRLINGFQSIADITESYIEKARTLETELLKEFEYELARRE